jgi:hypothetical protein
MHRMSHAFADITFTPSVKAAQERDGSRVDYERAFAGDTGRHHERLGEAERSFIEAQRSFFMATVSESGWPYVQHRGGLPGFLRVLDDRTLAFADLTGNRQMLSVGHLAANDRVALILVDYTRRARLKILGRLSMREVDSDDPALDGLVPPQLRARARHIMTIRVEAWDRNCPAFIPHLVPAEGK